MGRTRVPETDSALEPDPARDKSMLEFLRFGFNASVVAFSIVFTLTGVINLLTTNINLMENKYTAHALQYNHLFFSLWGTGVQTLYYYVILAIDVIGIFLKNNSKLNNVRNKLKIFSSYLFFTAVFPMSVAICSLFWQIYSIDRELVYPRMMDDIYPFWINHFVHTYPVGLVLIYIMTEKEAPMKYTMTGMMIILAFYGICVRHVRLRDNIWMYMFFHEMREDRVTQLLICLPLTCLFCTVLGHALARAIQCVRQKICCQKCNQ